MWVYLADTLIHKLTRIKGHSSDILKLKRACLLNPYSANTTFLKAEIVQRAQKTCKLLSEHIKQKIKLQYTIRTKNKGDIKLIPKMIFCKKTQHIHLGG